MQLSFTGDKITMVEGSLCVIFEEMTISKSIMHRLFFQNVYEAADVSQVAHTMSSTVWNWKQKSH